MMTAYGVFSNTFTRFCFVHRQPNVGKKSVKYRILECVGYPRVPDCFASDPEHQIQTEDYNNNTIAMEIDSNEELAISENEARISLTVKKKKSAKRYVQQYKEIWEKELPWLEQRGESAYCKVCESSLKFENGGIKDLRTHQRQETHKKAASAILNRSNDLKKMLPSKLATVDACIRLCLYAVHKNISFRAMDELIPTLKASFPDSKIPNSVRMCRTKAARIIIAVTGETQKNRLIQIMQQTYFSIIVDESTDITSEKVLCVVVRYYDENVGYIRDAFFDLIELDASNASSIKKAIVKRLDQFNIPYKKFMLGIGSDNAAVMVGQRHSVTSLLRDDCPHLVSVPCICHSLALCASYASKKLPDHLEQMLKDIYSYLSASPVRLQQFDFNPIRVPRMHDVRFLSRGQVVKAVLSRYEPLQIYFGLASNVDNLSNASKIHKTLADTVTEIYLLFLDFILPFVDNMNKLCNRKNRKSFHSMQLYQENLDSYLATS
ncbi:uncharacterized protein LOC129719697 isoform X1 [Wyeomyia smithii]|uniref:uncharacterized protein LOC129719697 isoform X1 n=2 Tax=Wyeomyia smithii TaxID=174621 RepID=UPI002467D543|nr:uncharacterized protein LOC129719697 isoform X1 [Wyeomyia smithii]